MQQPAPSDSRAVATSKRIANGLHIGTEWLTTKWGGWLLGIIFALGFAVAIIRSMIVHKGWG